jgi:hypothetical protein
MNCHPQVNLHPDQPLRILYEDIPATGPCHAHTRMMLIDEYKRPIVAVFLPFGDRLEVIK